MAMVKCRECAANVSSQAPTCINCGISKPGQSKRLQLIALTSVAMVAAVVLLVSAIMGEIHSDRSNTLTSVDEYPVQPAANARADAVAFYNQVMAITGPCDLAEGIRAVSMVSGDSVTIYQEAKSEDTACLGVSDHLKGLRIPQSLGQSVATSFGQALEQCESAYLSQWSAAHSLENALDGGKLADMAQFRDSQGRMLAQSSECAKGLIAAPAPLGLTADDLHGTSNQSDAAQPSQAPSNSVSDNAALAAIMSATTRPMTEYNFDDYPSDSYSGLHVLPDFSGAQRPFRDYRTKISDGVKQGPVFAGNIAITEFGCGTDCGMGYAIDLTNGNVFKLPFGGAATLDYADEYHPNSRLLKVAWTGDSTNPACGGHAYFEWNGHGFDTLKRTPPPPPDCH